MYNFIWKDYCDWYIEFIKSYFSDPDKSEETKKSFDVTLKSRFLEKISSFPVKSGY